MDISVFKAWPCNLFGWCRSSQLEEADLDPWWAVPSPGKDWNAEVQLLNWALWSEAMGWHGFQWACLGSQGGRRAPWLCQGHVEERKKRQVSWEAWLSWKVHEEAGAVPPTHLHGFCLHSPSGTLGSCSPSWAQLLQEISPRPPLSAHRTSHPAPVPPSHWNPFCLRDKCFQ